MEAPDRPPLDLSSLARAVERLRQGLIQRFEYTYELSHRMSRRFVRLTAASPVEVDQMPFQDLIRTANQRGLLLGDWPAWHRFRDLRARTSHTYNADVADQVTKEIPAFLREAEFLYARLAAGLA